MESFDLARILKFLPGIILGLTIHEFSHAWVAHLSGDSTSRNQGRVTLNPFKHIDLLGFAFILFAGFGWAKPVQFNEQNLRKPQRDVIRIALAGPLSNAILAILLSAAFSVVFSLVSVYENAGTRIFHEVFLYTVYINWGLFVFNMIPLPPLDGSHVLFHHLRNYPVVYNAIYRYGSLILFGLLIVSAFSKINLIPIGPVVYFLTERGLNLFGYNL